VRAPQDPNQLLRYSHLGLQFALTVGLVFFGGLKADERLQTSPLFTLLGVALGFGIGLYRLMVDVYGMGKKRPGDGPDQPPKPPTTG
jgi:hypothetical protein